MSPTIRRIHEAELLGRISRARNLSEALSIVFDSVLSAEGIEKALVLVNDGQELRGVLGMAWDPRDATRVAVSLQEASHPLVAAHDGCRAGAAELSTGIAAAPPGRYLIFPIPGASPDKPCFGILLVGPDAREMSDFPRVVAHLSAAGPVLERIGELDRLRTHERQTEQQRDLLTSIVNTLPDPVLITDSENSILLENRRAESLFSVGETDSEGRRRAVEINNLLFSSFLTRSTIAGSDSNSRELNLVDPSEGGDLLFEVLSTQLPTMIAGEKAMVSVLRDVTDLKRATTELEHQFQRLRQAEQKSRRERDRLNLILENVGDPILVTDDQSNIILMNREAERLFEVLGGVDVQSRVHQDVRTNDTKFSSFISDFTLSPDATRVTEVSLAEPESGNEFPAEVVSGKVLNERGEMSAIVSVLHDRTKAVENERLADELTRLNENLEGRISDATEELEERNRQLQWQSEELQRAYRLKSQFLASMSHELRTPINALLGYTSLMRDHIYGELNTRQEEALSRMQTASHHLLELVNDILDLAKIEAGKMPVHVERVDVADLIAELSQTIEPMVRRKSLGYHVELDSGLPPLDTDRTKVKQIILNLLSNAVKFTRHGQVAVRARPAKAGITIDVEDSGIGIKEDDIPKIFEDFRQVDQSSTREYGGTGLGLSITKKLLHLLGGTIRVQSRPGLGSTFSVTLPLRSEEILLDQDISRVARGADQAVITDR
ncbi:MAG: PAS domain S-box protein [Gemmatimonadetes bacterium]|nr:PAS domain S-box protein [Gemmatimonadota bacterium]